MSNSIFAMSIALIIGLLFLGLMLVGAICLQIFLSKKPSKYLGLILPICFFSMSIIFLIPISINIAQFYNGSISNVVFTDIMAGLLINIPTIVLSVIFMHYRKKIHKVNEIDKMRIQDLE
jgi:hypothetical protein